MKKNIILLLMMSSSVISAQTKPAKTTRQIATEYVAEFNKLSDIHKKTESTILVNKLKSMDPVSKGIWLEEMRKMENKKVKTKKSNEEIEQMAQAYYENEILAPRVEDVQIEFVSRKLIEKISKKDLADKKNSKIDNQIDSISAILVVQKAERLKLMREITNDSVNNNSQSIRIRKNNLMELEDKIRYGTAEIKLLLGTKVKGYRGRDDYDDNTITQFLVKTSFKSDDGVDVISWDEYSVISYHIMDNRFSDESNIKDINNAYKEFYYPYF